MVDILITTKPADRFYQEPLGLFLFLDQVPPRGTAGMVDFRLRGALSRDIIEGRLDPEDGSPLIKMSSLRPAFPQLVFIGGGRYSNIDIPRMRKLVTQMITTMTSAGAGSFAIAASDVAPADKSDRALAEAIFMGIRYGMAEVAEPARGLRGAPVSSIRLYWPENRATALLRELRFYRHHSPKPDDWRIEWTEEDLV